MKQMYADSNYATMPDRLFNVLSDENWHSTEELVQRVGHNFVHAKFVLVHSQSGLDIEKRPHSTKPRQYEYRLIP